MGPSYELCKQESELCKQESETAFLELKELQTVVIAIIYIL